jgi:hypothetical protein
MQRTYPSFARVAWQTYLLVDISLQVSGVSTYCETQIPPLLRLFWHFIAQ